MPANANAAVRLASIVVTETFGVVNSRSVDSVKVRSPPITATGAVSLSRYDVPASKNASVISALPVTVLAAGP
jgi:hypothetical protein